MPIDDFPPGVLPLKLPEIKELRRISSACDRIGRSRISRSRPMLIECVPNFSEGRDRAVIDAITREIADTEGAALLALCPEMSHVIAFEEGE